MDDFTYPKFLQNKLKDEHTLLHLYQEQITEFKLRNNKLLKDIAASRKLQTDVKLKYEAAVEKMTEMQIEIRRLKENRNIKAKESTIRRLKEEKANQIDPKQIFRSYLDNTFPKYKGMIKKMLKIFFIMEEQSNKEASQKIKFYQAIFEGFVKRVLDWIFPKKKQNQKNKQIAENIVQQWRKKEKDQKSQIDKANIIFLKQASYIKKIEEQEAEILMLKSNKSMLESRMKTYQKSLQSKGAQFVVHLKKMLQHSQDFQPQAHEKVDQIMKLFISLSRLQSISLKEQKEQQKSILQQIPLILTDKTSMSHQKRKAAPILKKNIYGYYQDPQFAGNLTLNTMTKHPQNNKQTQTLSQDLCILTTHPVIMVTLIDGSIKPQRNRHSLQFYVKIRVGEERNVDSDMRESLQPIWNQPFLLKDYDFPFLHIQLMHKSKGLRDYAIGGGKFSASSEQQKIVNVRKQKEFQGRIRFSLVYPKGNIYEFKITSIQIQIPIGKIILKEETVIKFPYNQPIKSEFVLPEKIVYLQKSVIILENSEEFMQASMVKLDKKQKISLKQFIGKEGNKRVIIEMGDDFKIILQGEVYLLICQDQQPQKISEAEIEGGRGKYFSVRAPPPIVTVTYKDITLHANIKFPLVFRLSQQPNRLSIVKQLSNRQLSEQFIDTLTNSNGLLLISSFIKAPSKIYQFFIQNLEGEKVYLKHQNHLFQRLLKQIHLYVSYRQNQVQQISYARKGKLGNQQLYKQFVIETKELMLNHYKIFSKHFKRIGFVKFKLGYTIHDNLLQIQNQQKLSQKVKSQPIQFPSIIRQGECFLQMMLTEAHLQTKSSGSTFSVRINNISSGKVKSNHPVWNQGFTIAFMPLQKLQIMISYQIIQDTTFGSKVVYSGDFMINEAVIKLEYFMIQLNKQGDCLHFTNIKIPKEMFKLRIQSIQAEIEEDADWIGKIDPYLTLTYQNRIILKSQYLDNIGSHPVWNHINTQLVIGRRDNLKDEQQIIKCQLKDYDLIGKDDYLGEVIITAKLNPQINEVNGALLLYGNIVKNNQICGSIKFKGKFQKYHQKTIKISQSKPLKLYKKDMVYRLAIYKIQLSDLKQYQGDKGWLHLQSKDKDSSCRINQFIYQQKNLGQLQVVYWGVNECLFNIQLKRQYKSFFKLSVETVGSFTISLREKQFNKGVGVINDKYGKQIGKFYYFVEIQSKIKYADINLYCSCRKNMFVKSDLGDYSILRGVNLNNDEHLLLFYYNSFTFCSQDQQTKQIKVLSLSEIKKNVVGLEMSSQHHSGLGLVAYVEKDIQYEYKLQERCDCIKIRHDRQFKMLKYLHWQPYKYEPQASYKFIIKLQQNSSAFDLKQQVKGIYNDYLVLKQQKEPIIFQTNNLPKQITIVNSNSKIQNIIKVSQDITKIFLPNRGSLFYQLENYNQKSILQLHFSYLFIRLKDVQKLQKYQEVNATLTCSENSKTLKIKSILQNSCFLFQNFTLLIAQPSNSGTFFLTIQITGMNKQSNQQQILQFKTGLRLQNNKQQYRLIDNTVSIIHTLFSSTLIQRKYQQLIQKDLTIYGMSFIKLEEIQFQNNDELSNKNQYVEIRLDSQYQKIVIEREKKTNKYVASSIGSLFFIQKNSNAQIIIVEQGILSNSVKGKTNILFSSINITKNEVSMRCEVKSKDVVIGTLLVRYLNMETVKFIDVNIFSFTSKNTKMSMVAQLRLIGSNKQKYQRIELTGRGNTQRLESEDSFILSDDPRNYQITVSEKNNKNLLGEFKLCHQLNKIGQIITVLQPLRISSSQLNGILFIDYQMKESTNKTVEEIKSKSIQLVQLEISKLTFKGHLDKIKDSFMIKLITAQRTNMTKLQPIQEPGRQKTYVFTIYNEQNCEIILSSKSQIIGRAKITHPYYDGEVRTVFLQQDNNSIGICLMKIKYLGEQKVNILREIVSVEAVNLKNTQYFIKMKPYLQFQYQSQSNLSAYSSELGIGRQKIFWKINLILAGNITITAKDRDMFYDDYIGSVKLQQLSTKQKQQITFNLQLQSEQKEAQKYGNGTIKIITAPVMISNFEVCKRENEQVKINGYIIKLGGLSAKYRQLLRQVQTVSIYLAVGQQRIILFKGYYVTDVQLYLGNRDIQLEVDTAFFNNISHTQVEVQLCKQNKMLMQQIIPLTINNKNIQTQKLFTIIQTIPIQRNIYSLKQLIFWIPDKLPASIQVFASTNQCCVELKLIQHNKRLIIIQPSQLINVENRQQTIICVDQNKIIFSFNLLIDCKNQQSYNFVCFGAITNMKEKQIGNFYVQIQKYHSEGSNEQTKLFIGKSKRKWLSINISEAFLTKDLQFFSKMDPYCRVTILSDKKGKEQWKQTSVQDNIGMHPIWNEQFLLQIIGEPQKSNLKVMVMDSQVTIDRMIGQGTKLVSQLASNSQIQIEVFYENRQLSGRVVVTANIVSNYIVFRNVVSSLLNLEIFVKHQQNRQQEKGLKLELGVVYPIDSKLPLTIVMNGIQRKISWKQLQQIKSGTIIFQQECVAIYFDLFD